MRNTNTKSLVFFTIALLTFSVANSQVIIHSSIASVSAVTSNEVSLRSQSIGRMHFPNKGAAQTTTGISNVDAGSNNEFGTMNVYPNPAVGNIHFAFELPETGNASVSVYNEIGQKLSDVSQDNYEGGKDTHQINLANYPSGVYFLNLNFTSSKDGQLHTITKKFQVIN